MSSQSNNTLVDEEQATIRLVADVEETGSIATKVVLVAEENRTSDEVFDETKSDVVAAGDTSALPFDDGTGTKGEGLVASDSAQLSGVPLGDPNRTVGWFARIDSVMGPPDEVKQFFQCLSEMISPPRELRKFLGYLWEMKAPLFCIIAIAVCPKFILLWLAVTLAKPISLFVFRMLPASFRERFVQCFPSFRKSPFLRDLGEGADQGLPFVLFWLYLACAPFALTWMLVHWIRSFFDSHSNKIKEDGTFVFAQSKSTTVGDNETNFYHSRVFGLVILLFFATGIPAFMSLSLYENLGVEKTLMNAPACGIIPPSYKLTPAFVPRVGSFLANESHQKWMHSQETPHSAVPSLVTDSARNMQAPEGMDSTVVQGIRASFPWLRHLGLEPTKQSVFFVHFYLFGVASAMSILFFRAWFSFPLNFIADDHDVEFAESGIKRNTMRGWMFSVITLNRWAADGGPDRLAWSEVKSLRRWEEGFSKLCPLPETIFKKETLTYKLLNRLAAFMEGITRRPSPGNYLVFSSTERGGDFGKNIKINLNHLSRVERAKLYYSVKKWAPQVLIHEGVEEQLVGSTVLKDNRYTQLWFDLLTTRSRSRKTTLLPAGEKLKSGEYTIDERISSGGQATTYLATKPSGEKCVLKEFILATSTSGALIESAREFEAEVSLLSQLDHPGIVKLQDFFSEDGRLYVAMEYIAGMSLRQKVQQEGALSEHEVRRIGAAVCDVLEYLHGCNPPIVHRDITPENILIQPDGIVKVIDFSLAVKQDGRQTTDSCAKQAFTPPEQFREEICIQSDLYALGATMYFLLTAFTPKPISCSSPSKKVEVSAEMNSIVERATQLDLTARYESAHWLKLDLCADESASTSTASKVRSNPG